MVCTMFSCRTNRQPFTDGPMSSSSKNFANLWTRVVTIFVSTVSDRLTNTLSSSANKQNLRPIYAKTIHQTFQIILWAETHWQQAVSHIIAGQQKNKITFEFSIEHYGNFYINRKLSHSPSDQYTTSDATAAKFFLIQNTKCAHLCSCIVSR